MKKVGDPVALPLFRGAKTPGATKLVLAKGPEVARPPKVAKFDRPLAIWMMGLVAEPAAPTPVLPTPMPASRRVGRLASR